MAIVTVPGAPLGTTFTYTYNNAFNTTLAQSIANVLAAASSGGSLLVNTIDGSGSFPVSQSGGTGELVMQAGSANNVTVGAPIFTGYSALIDELTSGDTINGASGLSVMGGDGNDVISNAQFIV